jgi:hypothetical protein
MSFLRRLLGGEPSAASERSDDRATLEAGAEHARPDDADDEARDRELLREDAARMSDELIARQLRYADLKWTPPTQGSGHRADETDDADG